MSAGSTGTLSDRDIQTLAGAVARGEEPKVAVAADHDDLPAGTAGLVTGYDGQAPEPFTVRFALPGGDRELSLPASVLAVVPRTRAEIIARTRTAGPPDGSDGDAAKPGADSDAAKPGADGDAAKPGADGDDGATEDGARRRPRAAKQVRKPARSGGDVVITMTVSGDGATVEATHGTRKLVKGVALPVAAGHALAQLVNVESVTAAVESVITEHRAAKEAEAGRLRDRLAELEQELAQYQDIG